MRTSYPRILAGLIAALALLVGPALTPAAAAPAATGDAILGTWVGTYSGFESGTFVKGMERFVLTTARGANVKGTWQFRATSADRWSAKKPMQLVVLSAADGGWTVTGADENGIYAGTLDSARTRLDLAYQGSVNDLLSYHFVMRRK